MLAISQPLASGSPLNSPSFVAVAAVKGNALESKVWVQRPQHKVTFYQFILPYSQPMTPHIEGTEHLLEGSVQLAAPNPAIPAMLVDQQKSVELATCVVTFCLGGCREHARRVFDDMPAEFVVSGQNEV